MSLEIRKTQVDPDRWTFTSYGDPVLPYDRSDGFYESFVNDDQVLDHTTYRRLVATLIAVENELALARAQHRQDIKTISYRMMSEAQERGWCNVYDAVVAELNESELHVQLQERRVIQTITIEMSVEVNRANTYTRDRIRALINDNTPFTLNSVVDDEMEAIDN